MLFPTLPFADEPEGFHGPSIEEFFPEAILFAGTPFELNRVMLIRLLAVAVLVLILWLGTRRMRLVPSRGQAALEYLLVFVKNNIVIETLGEKDGKRFMPLIMSIFFLLLFTNLTGVIPPFLIAGSSTIGLAIVLAIIAYVVFIYAGIKKHGVGRYFKNQLFPAGVPWPLYILLTPVEFLSTFILRPITLTLRLLMNMVAGHMLLVLVLHRDPLLLLDPCQRPADRTPRSRHLRLRHRVHPARAVRRRAAGLRLRHPHRHLHPALARKRALIPASAAG